MNSGAFSRRPIFWVLLSFIFLGGSLLSFKYFARVFPIINIDIEMNRVEALKAGKELAQENNWGPADYQQAVLFDDDDETQNFIELEGGGKKVFAQILEEKYFHPYIWQVRHFKQGDPNETIIAFTPEGKRYGFEEKLSENTPGAALDRKQAQEIAEKQAKENWHTDFTSLTLVESSQETKQSGRIDHTFVYERTDKKVGGAPYRLKLVVSGDKLTQYELSIKVPEAFKRRYEQMRSANNTIAQTAGIISLILYIFGGCVLGLFFLLRRRWLLWKTPLFWGSFIAFLQLLNGINSLPMYWMRYDTQLTKITFLTNFFIALTLQFFAYTGIFTFIFMAAESLGRKAFPQHLQLWRLWSRQAASSIQVLGRTIGGYLILGFDFAFIIGFYYIAFRYWGWWSPSETLINPNILSYYVPWLASISQALQAGFMEECLFRAVPLSCAALIGKKRGNKTFWLIIGMIVQAIIFSAAHANYPAQPAYARLAELLVPSIVFGCIYIFYGLLPAIISHFVYDVIWMALPLFLSTAPGLWIDQSLVILCASLPLLIVFIARLVAGRWSELSTQFYNYAWQPKKEEVKITKPEERLFVTIPQKNYITMLCIGFIGILIWAFSTQFKQDGLPIKVTQQEAMNIAESTLKSRNIHLGDAWQKMPYIEKSIIQDHDRFVWQTAGKKVYEQLLGTYLTPAQWKIRFAQFGNEDIVERAEEYTISIDPNGSATRFEHQLPESRPGKLLTEAEARTIAHDVLKKEYHLDPTKITEISAISTKHPARIDWEFTFKDPAAYPTHDDPSKKGEARISIEIDGDQVSDYSRYVFIPEAWSRADKQQQAILTIITLLCTLFVSLFFILGGVNATLQWNRHQFATRFFIIIFSLLIAKSFIQTINLWPSLTAAFKTSEPYWHQVWSLLSSLSLQIVFKAAAYALLFGFVINARFRHFSKAKLSKRWGMGMSLGTLLAGFEALCTKLSPSLKPLWAEYIHAGALFPSISYALTTFTNYLYLALLIYMIFWSIDYLSQGWKTHKVTSSLLLILVGIALNGASGIEHIVSWFSCGILIGVLLFCMYIFIIRFDRTIIPLFVGSYSAFEIVPQATFNAYPGALLGAILGIILIFLFAHWWSQQLIEKQGK